MNGKKIAIIGASYLQLPLIEKAKMEGCITYVFAWHADDPGEKAADYFFPISIIEKERILEKCIEIGIDGICSIASDLAMLTVNYVAEKMHLCGNSFASTIISTNKYEMRRAFLKNGDPSPSAIEVSADTDLSLLPFQFPIIVKPTDRSGSRGVCKVQRLEDLHPAVNRALEQSFERKAIIEEFIEGIEYSVEYLSFQGAHYFLALTQKFTTGAPHFIEKAHLQPADVSRQDLDRIKKTVEHALDTLGLANGASHSEIKINGDKITIVEIGGRMGGDLIGSHLVPNSCGYDYLKAVLLVALGIAPEPPAANHNGKVVAVRFILDENDLFALNRMIKEHSEYLIDYDIQQTDRVVTDSSTRKGYFVFQADKKEDVERCLAM